MRRTRDPDSSLFPFLSVLACVLGTLTLLIAALAVGQVAESLLDPELSPEQAGRVAAERASLRLVEAELARSDRVQEELGAVRAALRARGLDPDQPEDARLRDVEARHAAVRLARRVEQLEARERELGGSIQGVEVELTRERPQDDQRPIRILPHGSGQPLRPFFVECRREGMRIYDDDFRDSVYLSRGDIDDQARFSAFLQRVRGVRDGTVIFLIRPDGVETYLWAAERSGRLYVRSAKLPLPGQGPLELSL